jgi:hypothetical protein
MFSGTKLEGKSFNNFEVGGNASNNHPATQVCLGIII